MGLFIVVLHHVDGDFALRLLGSRVYWAYREGPGSGWESFVNRLFTLHPIFSHAPTPTPFFFFWSIPPWSLSFPGNEQLRRSGFFFFSSPQIFVTCPIKLTATYKEKYPQEGLDALQDFQLGHPASLLCPCAQCPGVDRRGERKKKGRRWGRRMGENWETNTKCSGKTRDKTSSPTLMLFPFSASSIRGTIPRQGNF